MLATIEGQTFYKWFGWVWKFCFVQIVYTFNPRNRAYIATKELTY